MSVAIMKSYDMVGVKEDISDIITNISPTKTPFQAQIGTEGVHQIHYQWQEDSLIAAGANAQVEGAAAPSAVMNATVLRDNYTQIFSKTAQVSGTANVTKSYGRDKELAYQLSLRSAELKRDLEYALVGVNQTFTAGSDSVARVTASYMGMCGTPGTNAFSVYTVNSASGALNTAIGANVAGALREDIVTTVAQSLYNQGADPDTLMVKPSDALLVSGFQANNRTRFVENGQRTIVNTVDLYTSPFGDLKVVKNRFILTSTALVYEGTMWKRAVLRNWFRQTLAITGDATTVQIIGEFGLKHRNFAASGGVINLT